MSTTMLVVVVLVGEVELLHVAGEQIHHLPNFSVGKFTLISLLITADTFSSELISRNLVLHELPIRPLPLVVLVRPRARGVRSLIFAQKHG